MRKPLIALIVIVLVIMVIGIITSIPAAKIVVTEDEVDQAYTTNDGIIQRQIAVNSGDSFTATLYAHLGAGMRWSYSVDIPGVLRPDGSRELIYDNPYGFGGPGKEVWTFKAPGEGIATITMTYSFAFGSGGPNVNSLEIVVEVK